MKIIIPILLLVTIVFGENAHAREREIPWSGYLKNDKNTINEDQLNKIVKDYELWLSSYGKEGIEADLREAYLPGANLSRVDLSGAQLSGARLDGANLQEADLSEADLSKSYLIEAYLNGANLSGAHLSGANLIGATLIGAYLSGAYLIEAYLHQADLSGAGLSVVDLQKANLHKANLSKATLIGATLIGANLSEANLSGADLREANLNEANLSNADLSKAYLTETNLSQTDLSGADLSGADLSGADLGGAVFEPKQESILKINNIDFARNLYKLKYSDGPKELMILRNEFKKSGLRRQEREITRAIKYTQILNSWNKNSPIKKFEAAFNYVFFELTCQYGMKPGRPLIILMCLIPSFSFLYIFALKTKRRKTGLWLIFLKERVLKKTKQERPFKLTAKFPPRVTPTNRLNYVKLKISRSYRLIRIALYFSLLSTTSIGWREFNIGNWITRIQRREYTLRATGWVRTVSGLQSLISVYLLALWVLTYFGRPFEVV